MTKEEAKAIKFYSFGCINCIHWDMQNEFCNKHNEPDCWYYLCCDDHEMKKGGEGDDGRT